MRSAFLERIAILSIEALMTHLPSSESSSDALPTLPPLLPGSALIGRRSRISFVGLALPGPSLLMSQEDQLRQIKAFFSGQPSSLRLLCLTPHPEYGFGVNMEQPKDFTDKLRLFETIETYHRHSAFQGFDPNEGELLSQIPYGYFTRNKDQLVAIERCPDVQATLVDGLVDRRRDFVWKALTRLYAWK